MGEFEFDYSAKKQKGTMYSVIVGTIGTLLLGVGMSITMIGATSHFILGIVIGLIGIAVLAPAYFIFKKVTEEQRKKIAPQILALTEELQG